VLTLYYRADDPHSLRTRLVLSEKLLPFSRRVVSVDAPAELADLSGGEIPALVDGSFAVTDSAVIAEYLEDAFPKPALRPFDARGRAVVRGAMRRVESELMASMGDVGASESLRTDKRPDEEMSYAFASWEHRLGDHGLLYGMEFSLADVWLLSAVEKAESLGFALPSSCPKFERWLSRIRERASVRAERLG
jgi:glutathione S-transferase